MEFIISGIWGVPENTSHHSAHIQVCHVAVYYLPTALHKGSWAKCSFNRRCKLTRCWMCSIQRQELKTLSKSRCFGDRPGWLSQHQQTCSVRAADLLCLRKHDPPDLVVATKAHHLLLIPGCICTTCFSLSVTYAALPFIKSGPSRHSAGVVPKYSRN